MASFNPGQYDNDANPAAFERWVAPELWDQTNGKMTILAAGLGTTGTLVGMSRYFRRNSHNVALVGAICRADSAVPGVRSEARLREIGFAWREASDSIVEIGTRESFKWSLQLCRWGLMAGPSSGFALAGLLHFLENQVGNSTWIVCEMRTVKSTRFSSVETRPFLISTNTRRTWIHRISDVQAGPFIAPFGLVPQKEQNRRVCRSQHDACDGW